MRRASRVTSRSNMSVAHGQRDARPTVAFPAAQHHRPLAGAKIITLLKRGIGSFEQNEQLAATSSETHDFLIASATPNRRSHHVIQATSMALNRCL